MGHLWKKFFRLFAVRYAGIYHDDRLCRRWAAWFIGNDDRLYGDEVFYHGGGDCLCGDKRQNRWRKTRFVQEKAMSEFILSLSHPNVK